MAHCPVCKKPGAYIGFNSIECRNPECEHFTVHQEKVCPCCGQVGHSPEYEAIDPLDNPLNPYDAPDTAAGDDDSQLDS